MTPRKLNLFIKLKKKSWQYVLLSKLKYIMFSKYIYTCAFKSYFSVKDKVLLKVICGIFLSLIMSYKKPSTIFIIARDLGGSRRKN